MVFSEITMEMCLQLMQKSSRKCLKMQKMPNLNFQGVAVLEQEDRRILFSIKIDFLLFNYRISKMHFKR